MDPITVIVNASGGSFDDGVTEQEIRAAFAEHDLPIDLRLAKNGEELTAFAAEAPEDGSQIVVAGGGDGTINLVAGHLISTPKTLGVLPLGTLNHFARDLGIGNDIAAAVSVIAEGNRIEVDVGEVNGRIFLNNSSIGLYPSIVRKREVQQERLGRGKWSAALIAALRSLRRDPFYRVTIDLGEKVISHKTPFVFVGNNEYLMDLYNIGRRDSLNGSKLSIYFLKRAGRLGVIVMLIRTFLGRLRQWKDFETMTATKARISVRKKSVLVACDGEVELMDTPLDFRTRPGILSVLAPRVDENA